MYSAIWIHSYIQFQDSELTDIISLRLNSYFILKKIAINIIMLCNSETKQTYYMIELKERTL